MAELTPRERFLKALRREAVDRPPVTAVNQTVTVEQMERAGVYWPEAHKDAELMARLAGQAWGAIGIEGVGVPFCQSVEAEALGCPINYGNRTQIPAISLSFKGYASLGEVRVPKDLATAGRVPVVLKALKLLRERYPEVPVMGRIVGPFSAVACLGEMNRVMMAIVENPGLVKDFTKAATGILTEYGKAMYEAGADAVVIEDMIASGDILGRDLFTEFAQPYLKELIGGLHTKGPVILHLCGHGDEMIEAMVATEADGLSVDHKTDARGAVAKAKGKAAIIGNLNAPMTLGMGTPEEVRREAVAALEAGVGMVAPGCMISPITKDANLRAMVEAVKGWRKR